MHDIIAMLSVQSPGGLAFGTAVRVDARRLFFEIEARLTAGDRVEFRMELPGMDDAAQGMLLVVGERSAPGQAVRRWEGAFESIVEADRELFSAWLDGVMRGGRMYAVSHRKPDAAWLGSAQTGSSPAERALAMRNEEERRKRRGERLRVLAEHKKGWPDPHDLTSGRAVASGAFRSSLKSSVSSARTLGSVVSNVTAGDRPRAAMAAALRNVQPRSEGESVALPAWPLQPRTQPPAPSAPAPSAPTPTSTPPSRPAPNPPGLDERRILVDRQMVSVVFPDAARYRAVRRAELLSGSLILPGPIANGTRLQLWLTLPSGATVSARGTATEQFTNGVRVALELDAPGRTQIGAG